MRMKIIILAVLLGLTFFSTGCAMRLNKHFDYKQAASSLQQGEIRARLMGTFSSSEKETVKDSPYDLLISFSFSKIKKGSVVISDVRIHEASTNKLVFNGTDFLEEEIKVGSDGIYRTYFSLKGMELEYVRYKLLLKVQVKVGDQIFKEDVELYLDKDYREFKSSDFWQKIMSV